MSDLGPINLGPDMGMGDFGQLEWYDQPTNSQAFMEKVDVEVKKILDSCYESSLHLIKTNRKLLDKVSEALLKDETLDRDQFEKIVGSKKV
jgi:cell division protease FtsH